jgi:hypothetical protein
MLIKAIDTKTVYGGKTDIQKLVLSDEKKSHFLYRVWGVIEGYLRGESKKHTRTDKDTGEVTNSTWVKFGGDFRALKEDGTEYEAAVCFLPPYVTGPIVQAIDNAGESEVNIQFAFDVFAVFDSNSATSYTYVCQPLKDAGAESKLAKMQAALPPMPKKALPAPKK